MPGNLRRRSSSVDGNAAMATNGREVTKIARHGDGNRKEEETLAQKCSYEQGRRCYEEQRWV